MDRLNADGIAGINPGEREKTSDRKPTRARGRGNSASLRDDWLRMDKIDPVGVQANSVGLARQAMAADLISRGDGWERGVRSVLLQNDRIAIEVVVDRALDIASARIHQIPIAWRSPTEIIAPWFVENKGFGPHRGFFGGLFTTCGLDHIGVPTERQAEQFGYRVRATDAFPMHGRISGSPARLLAYGMRESEGGSRPSSRARHAGRSLRRATDTDETVSIAYGSRVVTVDDEAINHGYASSPLAMMYHVNFGWPVVAPRAIVKTPPQRLRGEGDNRLVRAPAPGAAERVWIFAVQRDEHGRGSAGIANARIDATRAAGASLTWDASALPTLVQWQIVNVAPTTPSGSSPLRRSMRIRRARSGFQCWSPASPAGLASP